MVSILPGGSNWDVIGKHLGENVGRALPQAVQQGYSRAQGLSAIDQLQNDLAQSGGDISKMLPALARAYTLNPGLERSGLGQFALQQAKVQNAFGPQGQNRSITNQSQPNQMDGIAAQTAGQGFEQPQVESQSKNSFALPGPFNILTGPDINEASEQYARDINDPAGYAVRQAQLNNLNQIATEQRKDLEDSALKMGVSPQDLPKLLIAGKDIDTRNPAQWAERANQKLKEVKNNLDSLERSFFPTGNNALLGQNRENSLKKLQEPVSNLVKKGYEDDAREIMAENFMSPSEIEETIRPLTSQKLKAINSLPKGSFPAHKTEALDIFSTKSPLKYPLGTYEEAQITHPKELEKNQKDLADFFLKNVDKNTALLPLRDKIWEERDYDWQQFGPALKQAQDMGLELSPRQEAEISDFSTQPPRQSLPDIFKSFDRVIQYFRGNK